MVPRFLVVSAALVFLSIPASGEMLYRLPDDGLVLSAAKMKAGDSAGALAAALASPSGGIRDFMAGMAADRSGKWDDAAKLLEKSPENFPLLADYALYRRADALYRLGRFDEARDLLVRLLRDYPDTPLLRQAELLYADTLYGRRDLAGALQEYIKFIEKYASGPDAVTALYKSGICREESGDTAGAAAVYRRVWITYPSSKLAEQSEGKLKGFKTRSIPVEPWSADELFKRGSILYELKQFDAARETFAAIPKEAMSQEMTCRIALRRGQALLRGRRWQEAEQEFNSAMGGAPKSQLKEEALYWQAKALDKEGKYEEAASAFLSMAESCPLSSLADNALFEAALIRKQQGKEAEALSLMEKLLARYADSDVKGRAAWEIGWSRYLLKDYRSASEQFRRMTENWDYREQALYWYARALEGMGEKETATTCWSMLTKEFPFGFYALRYKKERGIQDGLQPLPANLAALFPVPSGYERVKALIAMGLYDNARRELAASRKKSGKTKGLFPVTARFYLEMKDFNSLASLFRQDMPVKVDRETVAAWGIGYPLAFNEDVSQLAAGTGVPESLVYAVIRAESNFLPTAQSPAGAVGLMQLMPSTAKRMAGTDFHASHLTQPRTNIGYGIRHLKYLLALFKGDVVLAVAAYNAGSANVIRWQKSFGSLPTNEFIENIPFPETREYVKRVLAGMEIYSRLYNLKEFTPPTARENSGVPAEQPEPGTA